MFTYSRTYTGTVRAVVADVAGTVQDFGSCAPAGSFIALFDRHGITVSPEQAREPMGLHKRDHIRAIATMPPVAAAWEERHGAPWTEDDINALYEEFTPLQLEALPRYTALIPGVVDTVDALRQADVRIAATTGYNRAMMDVCLKAAAEQGFTPDAAVCAEDVPQGRPAPWMIYRAMEALGVYPPEAVVKVGDTLPDIAAGLNAGVWTIGVAATGNMVGLGAAEFEALPAGEREARLTTARDAMRREGAHLVIDSFADVPGALDWINEELEAEATPVIR